MTNQAATFLILVLNLHAPLTRSKGLFQQWKTTKRIKAVTWNQSVHLPLINSYAGLLQISLSELLMSSLLKTAQGAKAWVSLWEDV